MRQANYIVKTKNENYQLITFELNDEVYGLNILHAESIERMTKITRVPQSPPQVLGVINLRGDIVPVINIKEKLGYETAAHDDDTHDTRIVIVQHNDYRAGIIVDRVLEVLTVPKQKLQLGTEALLDREKGSFYQVISFDTQPIMLLDIIKLLNFEDDQQR